MSRQRAPRWDKEVDSARTIFWFRYVGERLETHKPREIQRVIAPRTLGVDRAGDPIRNNKFLGYARGEHVPRDWLVQQAEEMVPRSAWALNHPLWQVLRTPAPIRKLAHKWVRELDPDIQRIVLLHGKIGLSANRHMLGSLERRAGLDSLAALTILLRLNHEQGESECAWLCAIRVFRTLLMLGPLFDRQTIAERIFQIYVTRIFSRVAFAGQRMALDNYDYPTRSLLLSLLADELCDRYTTQRTQRFPSFYPLQILDGKFQLRFTQAFQIPLVPVGEEPLR